MEARRKSLPATTTRTPTQERRKRSNRVWQGTSSKAKKRRVRTIHYHSTRGLQAKHRQGGEGSKQAEGVGRRQVPKDLGHVQDNAGGNQRAKKETWVYVVKGVKLEPLLGDHDTEDLGIITFNAGGKIQKTAQTPEYQASK